MYNETVLVEISYKEKNHNFKKIFNKISGNSGIINK